MNQERDRPSNEESSRVDGIHDSPVLLRLEALLWSVLFLLPLLVAGAILVVDEALSTAWRITVFSAALAATLVVGWQCGRRLLSTLGTVFDLLAAIREGDYSLRGRVRRGRDPLQGLIADINRLSDDLRDGRRKNAEASRFLGKTLIALHSAVFVVDESGYLRVINPAARRLIGAERRAIVGQSIVSLGLAEPLDAADGAILTYTFPTTRGRWAVRRATWHREGREHTLVMLQDLSAALSEEERSAWQRLIRVLSHELNNSLTPIGSLAETLSTMLDGNSTHAIESELRLGLEVIGRRSASLARFLAGYGRLARLPPLQVRSIRLDTALVRFARLEQRMRIEIVGSDPVGLDGDEDQLGQAFINLMRNAVEATLGTGGGVRLDWRVETGHVRVMIEDDGIGLPASDGMFVPFFTTKPEGSGIGLNLARLIVEAHAGSVELSSRVDGRGAVAVVRLPLHPVRPITDTPVRYRTFAVTESEQTEEELPFRRLATPESLDRPLPHGPANS
jgi:nitrogen fixation/metabolism regulation signal transduction histidine kinase